MIPLARWLCKIASHTVQRERSEKATRRKGEGGGRRQPLIHFLRKQELAGAPNDTGPTSRLPETVPLQNKNGSFYCMEMKPTGGGRSQDESRIPHVDPAWAAFLQQPDGGPIMFPSAGRSHATEQWQKRSEYSQHAWKAVRSY